MMRDVLLKTAEAERAVKDEKKHSIRICTAASCLSCGAEKVRKAIAEKVKAAGREDTAVAGVGCMGLCAKGPLVTVDGPETMYAEVTEEDAADIAASLDNGPVERIRCDTTTPFFQRQEKIVLENCDRINPERIEDYIAADGYLALTTAVLERQPFDIVDEIVRSGLRGRGGGGYPTGLKWSTVAKAPGPMKYVICNADEGDPGAFMDRSILECDPHRVLEGMAVAAYAVGASEGYIYIRAEYPLAVKRLKLAIRQAEKMGLLGKNIAGTDFSFSIDIRLGAGAFVCGEETALIASIEGQRGQPMPRPPYPAESGLWDSPTLINNVETFANIAPIIRKGADWYAAIGTETSKGTKVFALAGRINNTGLIEVPMGITLREIVYDIGGGIPDGKAFKAVQTGGPSGGCVPASLAETPIIRSTTNLCRSSDRSWGPAA